MKYLLVLLIVIVAAWIVLGRSRGRGNPPRAPGDAAPGKAADAARKTAAPSSAQPMVACTRCGVHLPRAEALADAQGRLFCGDAHRLAGPR